MFLKTQVQRLTSLIVLLRQKPSDGAVAAVKQLAALAVLKLAPQTLTAIATPSQNRILPVMHLETTGTGICTLLHITTVATTITGIMLKATET